MKKLLAILLLMLTLLSLSANAFAAGETGTGTITISNATTGKTYSLYKIFDATIYDPTVTPIAIAYTYTGNKWNDTVARYFSKDEAGNVRIIKETALDNFGNLNSSAVAALATLKGASADRAYTTPVNSFTFHNLPYGYYYIESTLDTRQQMEGLTSPVVSVNSTTPDAIVIDKNQGPTWYDPEGKGATTADNWLGKHILVTNSDGTISRVKENSVNFGDTVTFEVAFNATNYYGSDQALTYFLNDTIADGFEIDKSSLKVYFDEVKKTEITDYTVRWSGETGHEKTFTVAAPWHNPDGSLKFPNNANTVFKVTYNAVLLPSAVIAGDGVQYTVTDGNINKATFDYRKINDPLKVSEATPDAPPPINEPYHTCTPEYTVTYTYALGLTKVDGETLERLKGAEFTLKKGETVIKANPAATADGTVIPGVYEYSASGTAEQFATNDVGVLVIKGLEEGTYTLKEAKSPNGYNRSLEDVKFTFIRENRAQYVQNYTMEGVETNYEVNVQASLFKNERGVVLPITGGMGTTIFYILGGGLMFVAILLLITRKRMNNEK